MYVSCERLLVKDAVIHIVLVGENDKELTDVRENVSVALWFTCIYLEAVLTDRRQTNPHEYLQ